jgi:hypothetical protein
MCFQSDVQQLPPPRRPGGPRGPQFRNRPIADYGARFGVSWKVVRRVGIARLELCKDDEARRILLKAENRGPISDC